MRWQQVSYGIIPQQKVAMLVPLMKLSAYGITSRNCRSSDVPVVEAAATNRRRFSFWMFVGTAVTEHPEIRMLHFLRSSLSASYCFWSWYRFYFRIVVSLRLYICPSYFSLLQFESFLFVVSCFLVQQHLLGSGFLLLSTCCSYYYIYWVLSVLSSVLECSYHPFM